MFNTSGSHREGPTTTSPAPAITGMAQGTTRPRQSYGNPLVVTGGAPVNAGRGQV
ncbi:hypothetical protein DPMN_098387 [Dreissena polymorpha]|uniref:Uncharacterized protein n=1 Tax=Dreissena polymorpha TaxID=45954 RepID=A0A9D4LC04_DREPO|nr:hypothetical protein DPMN_098387 [Dreissena polymorpha]